MTPDDAARLEAQHRHRPTSAREHSRWQKRWRSWCAARGLDPDTAPATVVAAWIAVQTLDDGRPLGGRAAAAAARAVDELPARRALPRVRDHDDVTTQIEAAFSRAADGAQTTGAVVRGPRAEPPPLTVPAALLLLGAARPPAARRATDARQILAAAVLSGETLTAAAELLRRQKAFDGDRKHGALGALALRGAEPGTALHDRPWQCARRDVLSLHHRLDAPQTAWLRLQAAISLGWHCALEPGDYPRTPLTALTMSRTGLSLELPGGTVHARRADDPRLCAHRRLRRWLNARGADRPDLPLLCALGPDGPTGPVDGQTWDHQLQQAAKAAGMPGLRLHSLRLGYALLADQQGASTTAIRNGMRLSDDQHVDRTIARLRHRAPATSSENTP